MNRKNSAKSEEMWLTGTFLVILAAFALIIWGICAANMELCEMVWMILMAAMLSIPFRRRVFACFVKMKDNGEVRK